MLYTCIVCCYFLCLLIFCFPGNIFIHHNPQGANTESGVEEDFAEDEEDEKEDTVTYKIGEICVLIYLSNNYMQIYH